MPKVKVITSLETSEKVVKSLLCLDRPVIGVSCKAAGTESKSSITQITVSTCDDDVYIFDVRKQPGIILDGAIIRLLQSRELVKVFHDCRVYSLLLQKEYGVDINNYFDTQVAFSIILEQHGFPPRKVSLPFLCERFGLHTYTCDRTQQSKMSDVNYWALRPLSPVMVDISAAETLPLIPLYHYLTQDLSDDMVNWFECLSIDSKFFNPKRVQNSTAGCERFLQRLKTNRVKT